MRAECLIDTLLSTLMDIHSFVPLTWPTATTNADDAAVLTWDGIVSIRVLNPSSADHIGSVLLTHLTGADAAYTFQQTPPDRQVADTALQALRARPATGELAAFLRVAHNGLADMEEAA